MKAPNSDRHEAYDTKIITMDELIRIMKSAVNKMSPEEKRRMREALDRAFALTKKRIN